MLLHMCCYAGQSSPTVSRSLSDKAAEPLPLAHMWPKGFLPLINKLLNSEVCFWSRQFKENHKVTLELRPQFTSGVRTVHLFETKSQSNTKVKLKLSPTYSRGLVISAESFSSVQSVLCFNTMNHIFLSLLRFVSSQKTLEAKVLLHKVSGFNNF